MSEPIIAGDIELFEPADPDVTQAVIVNSIVTERIMHGAVLPTAHIEGMARLIVGDLERAGYAILRRKT